jgi:hypothetical protein
MTSEKTPGHGLHGEDRRQGRLRDIRGGTYDPPDTRSDPDLIEEQQTARQDEQPGADVRAATTAPEEPLPEGLRHRSGPMNKSSGRNPPGSTGSGQS